MDNTSASGKQFLDPASILRRLKIHPKMQVGDFGTGGGAFFALQAGLMVGEKGIVWAIDVYKPALSACASKAKLVGLKNIRPVWSNLEVFRGAKAIPDQSLDLGLLVNVLYHTKKQREVLRECQRMLKPGAKLLVIDWDVTGAGFGPQKNALVPSERVKQSASELGLTLLEEFDASKYHYGIVLAVPEQRRPTSPAPRPSVERVPAANQRRPGSRVPENLPTFDRPQAVRSRPGSLPPHFTK